MQVEEIEYIFVCIQCKSTQDPPYAVLEMKRNSSEEYSKA